MRVFWFFMSIFRHSSVVCRWSEIENQVESNQVRQNELLGILLPAYSARKAHIINQSSMWEPDPCPWLLSLLHLESWYNDSWLLPLLKLALWWSSAVQMLLLSCNPLHEPLDTFICDSLVSEQSCSYGSYVTVIVSRALLKWRYCNCITIFQNRVR